MRFDVITPFPEMLTGFFSESILGKAREKGSIHIKVWDLRTFTSDKHHTVDDYPYGGGSGMIMKPEPFFKAVDAIRNECDESQPRIVFLTPQGETYTQSRARRLSDCEHLIFICGHYRGVDERVVEALVTDEISLGDYILTGGELAAAVVIDSIVRLIPGVLGDFDSAERDSFSCDLLDHPHYTRPAEFRGLRVPEILLSGHHANIELWREKKSMERTRARRPDLLEE